MLRERPEVERAVNQVVVGEDYRVQWGRDEHAGRKLYLTYVNGFGSPDRIEVPVPEPVLGRFRELWMWRVEVARADPARYGEELKGFGWWFTSGKFDEAWAVAQLDVAVALAGTIDHELRVLPRLAKAAERFPLEAVRVLTRLLSGRVAPWRVVSWRESIEAVLRYAVGSGRQDAKHEAEQLTHRLGRAGYFEFRDVLGRTSE